MLTHDLGFASSLNYSETIGGERKRTSAYSIGYRVDPEVTPIFLDLQSGKPAIALSRGLDDLFPEEQPSSSATARQSIHVQGRGDYSNGGFDGFSLEVNQKSSIEYEDSKAPVGITLADNAYSTFRVLNADSAVTARFSIELNTSFKHGGGFIEVALIEAIAPLDTSVPYYLLGSYDYSAQYGFNHDFFFIESEINPDLTLPEIFDADLGKNVAYNFSADVTLEPNRVYGLLVTTLDSSIGLEAGSTSREFIDTRLALSVDLTDTDSGRISISGMVIPEPSSIALFFAFLAAIGIGRSRNDQAS